MTKWWLDLGRLMLVGLPAWRKTEIHVQNLTTDLHQSNVQVRNWAWAWGGSSPPPKRRRASSNWDGNRSFLHCCFRHHAVVIEGYSFVGFCIVDVIVQTILTCRNTLQQDGWGYASVFTIGPPGLCWLQHGPSGQKAPNSGGLCPRKFPPKLCLWTTLEWTTLVH